MQTGSRMKRVGWALAVLLAGLLPAARSVASDHFPGDIGDFHGFRMYTDADTGRRVVAPKEVAEGRPWVWRARFWGHEPQFDVAMLERGFHVVYCDVADLFGSPQAVRIGDDFYHTLVDDHHFSKKPVLEGMSRGGLFIYNWAAAHPDCVTAIYGDAPVMDFKSWPAGKRAGKSGPGADIWDTCLQAYGLTHEQALTAAVNPIDNLAPLAEAGVPILHVVGDDDDVVPVSENTAIAEARYHALGGTFVVLHKPGVGHHPHSLPNPTPIVDFVMDAWNSHR